MNRIITTEIHIQCDIPQRLHVHVHYNLHNASNWVYSRPSRFRITLATNLAGLSTHSLKVSCDASSWSPFSRSSKVTQATAPETCMYNIIAIHNIRSANVQ